MVLSFLFLLWICCGRAQDYVETSDSTREISQGGHNEPTAIENKQFCEGCVTTLKIDVEGISPLIEAAIKDIESERIRKQVLLELINLERQIVNGVKFSIAFKIGSTTCERDAEVSLAGCPVDVETDPEYCLVDFLQKPWLSKDKYVIYNNCTSKSYVYPEIETVETTTKSQELPPERVASIESQIVPEGDFFETIYDNGEVETNNLGSDNYYRGAEEDDYYEPEEKRRRVERDLNTSEDSKSNDTSVGSSEEKLRRTVRDLNTSEESRSNDTSSSEEHRRVPRGTKDSRAQSSLEKNDEKNDVSLDTLIKKNKNGGKSLSTHEDSITRHKRGADSSSSSSSSSSDDDNGNDNNINDKDNKKSKKGSLKKNDNDKNGNDDNDTSSSSSSDDDNGNNNNNKHRRKRAADLDRLSEQILLRNLGKYVTALYDSEDEDNLQQIPLSVVKTKKSIIEGLVYDLKIKIVTTDCDENKDILNSNNLLTYEPITNSCEETSLPNSAKLCKVKIYIPESYSNPKLLDSRCHTYSDGRIKRQIPGGIQTASVDAPEIIDLAESTLRLLDSESGHPNKYKIVKIHEASTQVVSGSLTKIKADIVVSDCPKTDPKHPKLCGVQTGASPKTCDIKIWDQPWLPQGRQTTVKCGGDTQKFRSKRDLGDALHVSPHAIMYTVETVHLLDDQTDYLVKLKPVRILNAIKQGEKDQYYTINIILGLSQCLKDSDMDVMKCPLDPHYHLTKCKILISHDIDKTHRGIERSIRCQNGLRGNFGHPPLVREKRQVGAPVPESVSDPTVINLTQSALRQFDSESPHSNKYKIIQIQDVTKQVVSGILYKITAEIILSDCPKTEPKDPNVCAPAKEAEPQVCQIEVWSRPWLKVGATETTVNCGGRVSKFRSRRSVGDSSFLDGSDDLKAKLSFVDFTNKYDVVYSSPDEARRRFKIFKSNLNRINLFNDVELGTAKYGVTRFADLTREEFKKKYLGLRVEKQAENEIPFPPAEIPDIELPKEFDWRDKGAVTAVKDQGSCGSCWAFSTTGNVEGQYAIKHGKLLEFSEQELVDCDTYDEGCGGGLMDNAYRAIEKLGGLELESDYPYDAKNEKCHFNKTMVKAELTGALNISQNEDDMAKWLTVNGPIAIAINANAMQFYVGGVSHPWKFLCNPKSLDHGVLIVGYGVHSYPNFNKTLPYWVVKNSWGKRWGEQGYYKVYRGDGTCGVNQTPSSGVVA